MAGREAARWLALFLIVIGSWFAYNHCVECDSAFGITRAMNGEPVSAGECRFDQRRQGAYLSNLARSEQSKDDQRRAVSQRRQSGRKCKTEGID